MSEFLRKYVSFVIHPFHTIEESGVEVFPQIYNQAIGFTIIFSALHKLTPFLLSTFYPSWYKQLEPAKRREMPTYLVSFAHHLIAVPIAWLHIYQDYQQLQSGAPMVANHYALKESFLVPFGCAFLFADILNYAFDEALSGRPMYLLHHALALALGKIF